MLRPRYPRKRLFLYLIPILIGMGGVRFSQELDDIVLRVIVLIMSVAIPVFAGGNLLARYKISLLERFFLFAGVILLVIGAFVSVSGISDTLMAEAMVSEEIANISRLLGIFSLLLGLFVVLFSVIRTREDVEEYGGRFWHLAEHMSEGFVLLSREGHITLVNKQFLEMFGLTEDELKDQTIYTLAETWDNKEVDQIVDTWTIGKPFEYQISHMVNNELRHFWFKGKPILDRYGQHTANLATVRDVTEQTRLTERVERYADGLQELVEEQTHKLLRSEERFRQLLHSMNEGFLTIDAGHHVRFANETICKLLKVREEELIGSDILDFIEVHGRSRILSILAQGEALSRSASRQEINLVRKDGALVPVLLAVAYIRDPEVSELLYSLVLTSVGELKEMQQELEQRARELERANEELKSHGRAKDSFLSNVSHELRTPLSTIKGYVEMLSSNSLGELNPQQQHAIGVMERNLVRIIGHINEIIDFSRMEIRGLELHYKLFYPQTLVEECVASVHPQALEKQVKVAFQHNMEAVPVWGDRDKLGQVLGILLNNAVKFTDPGGEVVVRLSADAQGTLEIAVQDTGIGIEPAYHDRVFDKFFQVDASMTRKYEGTGIGLSIAKSIVEIHQGSITLDSAEGEGCTFTIMLPQAVLKPDDSGKFQSALPEAARCLVVSEDGPLREALQGILAQTPLDIEFESNPYVCLRGGHADALKCIVYHPTAPDEEWLRTLQTLREHPQTRHVPLLLVTEVQSRRHVSQDPMWSGVTFCTIPFSTTKFLEEISWLLKHGESWADHHSSILDQEAASHQPTILIIDADPGMQEWLSMTLPSRHYHCLTANSPREALVLAREVTPNLVFLDVNMPDGVAKSHIQTIKDSDVLGSVPLCIMTGQIESNHGLAGVEGMLMKPFHVHELLEIIETTLQQTSQIDTGVRV